MLTVERSDAEPESAAAIASLINRAFEVEAWFVIGDRTSPAEVLKLLQSPLSAFFVAVEQGMVLGCVLADHTSRDHGYIGLLAVEPGQRGQGLGPKLMARAEEHLRSLGCDLVVITVIDLRTELFPFYERHGYQRTGMIYEFERSSRQACHLVEMTKSLRDG